MHGTLHTIAPSITVLVLTCHLDERTGASIDRFLRQDWETIAVPAGESYEILEPEFGKRQRAAQLRNEIHEALHSWVGRHMPGAFAQGNSEEGLTVDLLLTDRARPFDPAGPEQRWLSLLGMGHDLHVWRSESLPGGGLMMEQQVDHSTRASAVIAGRRDEMRGRLHDDELVNSLTIERVGPLLVLLTVEKLMRHLAERLGDVRDNVHADGSASDRLSVLRTTLLPLSSDLRTVTGDAARWAQDPHRHRLPDFLRQDFRNRAGARTFPELNLTKLILDAITGAAAHLRESDAQLRDGLVISTNLEATAADLSLQRRVAAVATFAAVVAVLGLFLN